MFDVYNNSFDKESREMTKEEKKEGVKKYISQNSCKHQVDFAISFGEDFNSKIRKGKTSAEIVKNSDFHISQELQDDVTLDEYMDDFLLPLKYASKVPNGFVSCVAYNAYKDGLKGDQEQAEVIGVIQGFYDRENGFKIDEILLNEPTLIDKTQVIPDVDNNDYIFES